MAFAPVFSRTFKPVFSDGAGAAPTPTLWSVLFNGSAYIDCSKTNGLDNLQDNELTIDMWIKHASTGSSMAITKGSYLNEGWFIFLATDNNLYANVVCATTAAYSATNARSVTAGNWHHIVTYFNDAGDRKIYFAVDGVWQAYSTQTAGAGAIVSDAARNLIIGTTATGQFLYKGNIDWTRISNNDRYNHGVNFTAPVRTSYPVVDANTVAQWNMSEGTGTTVDNAEGTATRDGTITNGTWEAG